MWQNLEYKQAHEYWILYAKHLRSYATVTILVWWQVSIIIWPCPLYLSGPNFIAIPIILLIAHKISWALLCKISKKTNIPVKLKIIPVIFAQYGRIFEFSSSLPFTMIAKLCCLENSGSLLVTCQLLALLFHICSSFLLVTITLIML